MTAAVQRRWGTSAQITAYIGPARELVIDTTNWRVVLQDGVTAGGIPLPRRDEVVLQSSLGTAGSAASLDGTGVIPIAQVPPYGTFRNLLRNPTLYFNQRGVTGTVVLAAGEYGHDGFKAGAGGATYTFAASGLDTTITISAGSLVAQIEGSSVEGGTYTLSNAGTATARIWQGSPAGSYAACPLTVTLSQASASVEFSTGTILRPQLERSAVASVFERRRLVVELQLCRRFFRKSYSTTVAVGANSMPGSVCRAPDSTTSTMSFGYVHLGEPMSSAPTITIINPVTGSTAAGSNGRNTSSGTDLAVLPLNIGDSGFSAYVNSVSVTAGETVSFHYTASCEL